MKFKALSAFVAPLALSLGLGIGGIATAQTVSVSSIVEHPALDSVSQGAKDVLLEKGYNPDDGFKWQFQTAQGNTAIAAQIARKFVGDDSDVIVAISTPSAQAVVAATKSIPVVYAAVTDPVAAQLVSTMEPTGTNVTGVSDALALEDQVDLILRIVPDVKNVGMVYNPGEANSVVVVEELRKILSEKDIGLVEATAARTVDVGAAARSLVGKVDAIYTNTDNNVVSAYESLVKVGNDAKIPLIASDTDSVERGAIAALGINYYNMGRQTGAMVDRILQGENPGDIPSEYGEELELYINIQAAEKQGVSIDEALLAEASKIIE